MALLSNQFTTKPFAQIFNNGVPEGVVFGEHADHEVLQNIPDEAIDEAFPPTAADAAEMDFVDDYIRALVDISFLEDGEERARTEFDHLKKRWEARRGDGLKGKPNPYKSELEAIVNRILTSSPRSSMIHSKINLHETKIVGYNKHERMMESLDSKLACRAAAKSTSRATRSSNSSRKKKNSMIPAITFSKNIQQPRKQNCSNIVRHRGF